MQKSNPPTQLIVSTSGDFLRVYLGKGRLAQEGLLNAEVIDATLNPDHLIWRDASPHLFVAIALEAWVRRWEEILSEGESDAAIPVKA